MDMRQFAQRIVVDHHLEPFSEEETGKYINHPIAEGGEQTNHYSPKRACSLVHRLSGGIPRLINQICDISLTYGFAEQTGSITSKLVAQAANDRSRGGILPLGVTEELSALGSSVDDPHEIPFSVPMAEVNVPSFGCDVPDPEPVVNQSAHDVFVQARNGAEKRETLQGRH
jgi:general secretion pathway protein A